MSIVSAQTNIIVVNSATTLLSLLDNLISLAVDPPSLYLDLEGVKLGRHISISIISLYIAPIKKIYFIDIHRLGKTAFSTTNSSATSLKTILESPTIPKVIFDIRNDSDALFSHFQIPLEGFRRRAKCIEKESLISAAAKVGWQRTKEGASRLYDPKKGGRYEIFNERPIKPEIIQYCARDVALLSGLYNVYNAKLRLPREAFWQAQVREATRDRIKLSQSPGYDGQAESKVRGPWDKGHIERAIDEWNDDFLFNALAGDNEDGDFDFDDYGDDDWNEPDNMSARDCMGWEEDMIKNGEYF